MTDFVEFTQDPLVDITSTPRHYHNFNGSNVRVQLYWTSGILADFSAFSHTMVLVKAAKTILQKYTLGLDVLPSPGPLAIQQKLRAKIVENSALKRIGSFVPRPVGTVASEILDSILEDIVDREYAKGMGVINYSKSIEIPYQARPDSKQLGELRKLIAPEPADNRLIVVFMPLSGMKGGYTVTLPDWLPWIIIDPITFFYGHVLMHEIGHACRLAHQKPESNVMCEYGDGRNFWGWQIDSIYDSYWCSGPKPDAWWEYKPLPEFHPFLWGN